MAQDRELYELIVAQLEADGYYDAANAVVESTLICPIAPSPNLRQIVRVHGVLERARMSGDSTVGAGSSISGPIGFGSATVTEHQIVSLFEIRLSHVQLTVYCSGFSSNGDILALAGQNGAIRVCETAKIQTIATQRQEQGRLAREATTRQGSFPEGGAAICLSIHPWLPIVATGHVSGAVALWLTNAEGTVPEWTTSLGPTPVTSLSWAPDGSALVCACQGVIMPRVIIPGSDRDIYRIQPCQELLSELSHDATLTSVAVSRGARTEDGSFAFICGYSDGTLALFDGTTAQCLAVYPKNSNVDQNGCGYVNQLFLDTHARNALVCDNDGNVRRFDISIESQKEVGPVSVTSSLVSSYHTAAGAQPWPLPPGAHARASAKPCALFGTSSNQEYLGVVTDGGSKVTFVNTMTGETVVAPRASTVSGSKDIYGISGAPLSSSPLFLTIASTGATLWGATVGKLHC